MIIPRCTVGYLLLYLKWRRIQHIKYITHFFKPLQKMHYSLPVILNNAKERFYDIYYARVKSPQTPLCYTQYDITAYYYMHSTNSKMVLTGIVDTNL